MSMKGRWLRTLVPAALACVLAAGSTAGAEITVVGGLTREVALKSGGQVEGRIVLRNGGNEPREVRVYQTDYLHWADGRSQYGEPGETARSNAKWLVITPRQVTVPAGGMESVYYTLRAPGDDSLHGTYWSMLMVEPLAPDILVPPPAEGQARLGIRQVMRYGIQVVVHIGDTGARDLRFISRELVEVEDSGRRELRLDLENTGERWLRPLVWAELYDSQGMLMGRFDGGNSRIYPGCTVRHRIDLSGVPEGAYTVLVVADNGDEHVFGARYTLEIGG